MIENEELKPCPFCGSPAYSFLTVVTGVSHDRIKYRVQCSLKECGVCKSDEVVSGSNVKTLMNMIDKVNGKWNTRANE